MKTIAIIILFYSLSFAQFTVDTTAVERVSADLQKFWCRATYEGDVQQQSSINDYIIGFLYGTNRDGLEYVPAGDINLNTNQKWITFSTEMANLPNQKIWVQGYVLPKSDKSKFEIGEAYTRQTILRVFD